MSQPRAVWSYLLMLKFQCNAIAIWQRFVLQERVCSLYLWELHKVLPEDAIVIEHNRFYQNIIFSALDCHRSMMETSVLGFMRFDNIGFATSALAWPHQRALQQLGREGQDCTDGTDGRSFQIRKVTRCTHLHIGGFFTCAAFSKIIVSFRTFAWFPKVLFNWITYHFYRHLFNG